MNARTYRTQLELSPVDFPAIIGLANQQDFTQTEPPSIIENMVQLIITKKLFIIEFETKTEHEVFTMQSTYQIPINLIQSRENIYECYNDTTSAFNEAYAFLQNQLPLPRMTFNTSTIDLFKLEIDGVFYLLNSLN